MRLRFVRFVALMIALVMPLQGMAAVMAAQCIALGHHQETASHASQGHASETHAEHDHSAPPHHDGAAGDSASDERGGNSAHCGPCTACCASASISGPVGLSIPLGVSNALYVFSQSTPPSVQLDGLDRPPTAL